MKPDITRFYSDEEIIQAAIEALRRRVAEVNGMMMGIDMIAKRSGVAIKSKSDLFDRREIIQNALNKVDAIAESEARPEVGEKLAGEPSQEAERPQPR